MEPFEDRTVALLNRGVPSFAVDSEGTLHTALMRSCTGWPLPLVLSGMAFTTTG